MGWRQNLKVMVNKVCPALGVSLLYYKQYKRFPRLRNPRLFNEKLQWLKLHVYGKDPVYTVCADKYKVREYLTERGFGDLLIPLIGVYERPEDIDFDALPDRFVLKWNFGSGYNIICNDKSKLDVEATVRKLREWGKDKNYAWKSYEMQYRDIPRRIVCEVNISQDGQHLVEDYKFQCFKGKVALGLVNWRFEDGRMHTYAFDRNMKRLVHDLSTDRHVQVEIPDVPLEGEKIDRLIDMAEKLSVQFPYVRVDLYYVREKIYFGEYTFSDGGGFDRKGDEADDLMSKALDINAYRKRGRQ